MSLHTMWPELGSIKTQILGGTSIPSPFNTYQWMMHGLTSVVPFEPLGDQFALIV